MARPIDLSGFQQGGDLTYPMRRQEVALRYWQSYETGNLAEVDTYSDTGTVEVVEDNFAGSTYALRLDSDGSAVVWASNRFYDWDLPEGHTFRNYVISPALYSGYWLKIVDMPATKEWLNAFYAADGSLLGGIQVDSSGNLFIVDINSTTVGTSTSTLTEGSTYYIEIKWQHQIADQYHGFVQVLVNGSIYVSGIGRFMTATGGKAVLSTISAKTKLNTDSWEYRIDDWWVSQVREGPVRSKLAVPISAANYDDFNYGGTYADIDELPPDGVAYRDTDVGLYPDNWAYYLTGMTHWRDTIGLLNSTPIIEVKFIGRVRNTTYDTDSTVAITHHFRYVEGGEDYFVHFIPHMDSGAGDGQLGGSYRYFQCSTPIHPFDGGPWTVPRLLAMEAGLLSIEHRIYPAIDEIRADFSAVIALYKHYPATQKDYLPYFDLAKT